MDSVTCFLPCFGARSQKWHWNDLKWDCWTNLAQIPHKLIFIEQCFDHIWLSQLTEPNLVHQAYHPIRNTHLPFPSFSLLPVCLVSLGGHPWRQRWLWGSRSPVQEFPARVRSMAFLGPHQLCLDFNSAVFADTAAGVPLVPFGRAGPEVRENPFRRYILSES